MGKINYMHLDSNLKVRIHSDNFYDYIFDDSEYGINESSKDHSSRNTPVKQKNGSYSTPKAVKYTRKNWDNKVPDDYYFLNIKRISKHQFIFGGNYFKEICGKPFKPLRRTQYLEFIRDNPKGWIIWDKVNSENDFSDCEMIWTSLDIDSHVVFYMWSGMMQGLHVSTDFGKARVQIGNKKNNEKKLHPTQKPVKIYEYLLMKYVKSPCKIADFKGGGGSIAIACHNLGHNLDIHEKDMEYFLKGNKRLKLHQKQLFLNFK